MEPTLAPTAALVVAPAAGAGEDAEAAETYAYDANAPAAVATAAAANSGLPIALVLQTLAGLAAVATVVFGLLWWRSRA